MSPILVLAGHDGTVAAIGGLLGIHWQVEGFAAKDIPPGGALMFERLTDASGRRFVRAILRSLSLDGIRRSDARDAATYTVVPIESCGSGGSRALCLLADFMTDSTHRCYDHDAVRGRGAACRSGIIARRMRPGHRRASPIIPGARAPSASPEPARTTGRGRSST